MMKLRILLTLMPIFLAGCSGNLLAPDGDPPKLYTLRAPAQVATQAAPVRWQLLIDPPAASLDLDSSRIAIAPAPARIDYYANVAWGDRVPAMIQSLLVESFDRSGRIGAVQRQGGGLKSDFVLASELRDFQVDRTGTGAVRIRMTEKLVRMRDRAIVASRTFETDAPVQSDNFDAAIGAFNTALDTLLPQIVDWTLTEGTRNP